MEALAAQHHFRPLIADELGEATRLDFGSVVYTLSGNAGTVVANTERKVAAPLSWRTLVLTAGEISTAEHIGKNTAVKGGQLDRAADIPTDVLPIFSDLSRFGSIYEFAAHLKNSCAKFYGTAAPALIQYLLDNPEAFTKIQAESQKKLEIELTPDGCEGGALRVLKVFIAAILTGYLAIDAKVFTCKREDIYSAFDTVIKLWWQQRTCQQPEMRIAKSIVDNSTPPYEGRPDLENDATFFLYENELLISRKDFDNQFPDNPTGLLRQLADCGMLRTDANNGQRFTKRHYSRKQATAYITIDWLKLEPFIHRYMDLQK